MYRPKGAADGLSLYGYHGELPVPLTIHPYYSKGETTKNLLPGEGVYSALSPNSFSPVPGPMGSHIRYGGLHKSQGPLFSPATAFSGEYLLTYNGNDNNSLSTVGEVGQITGNKPSVSTQTTPSRSVGAPLRIDGTSLLPRP